MKQPPASRSPILLFIRLSRPIFLLGSLIMYALGTGIAHYLGVRLDLTAFWLGLAVMFLLQLSAQYLNEYYDLPADVANPNRTFFSGGSGEAGLPRRIALLSGMTALAGVAVLVAIMIRVHVITPSVAVLLGLALIGALAYSVPPIRLVGTGYGELVASVLVANLIPAYAFLLQAGTIHRLVSMSTFPLTALHMAMLISLSIPDYANDLKFNKRSLLIRIGWQRGMLLHNLMVGVAYLLLAIAIVEGMPLRIAWPGFLTLPLGVFQIWRMNQIANGAPPRYGLLTFVAVALFALTAYLLAFSFWIA